MKNIVSLIGHIGQDPEVRRLENGTPVGRFSLATSESFKRTPESDWETETEWHNIVVYRGLAEQAEKSLKKGMPVSVDGKIKYRKYTDKNGIEKMITDIVATRILSFEKKERSSNMPTEEPANMPRQNSNGESFEVTQSTGEAPESQGQDDNWLGF